jgi:nucleotide-binding universal stress UspA family protein
MPRIGRGRRAPRWITRPSPLRTAAIAPSIDPMTTASQTPNVPRAHADAETSLTVLEGTLSQIAADSAVAADRLHEAGAPASPAPQTQAAMWWLHRVAASALATRATCRAARAAMRTRGGGAVEPSPASGANDSGLDGVLSALEKSLGPERAIVVGYDGSEAATRALARAADAAGEHGTVVIVATEPQLFSSGPAPEPLLEPGEDPWRLLAAARAIVAGRGTAGNVVVAARKGDPAAELLDMARAVGADRIVVGRRGQNFVARMLMGSVAARVVEQAPCDVLVVA